MVEIQVERPTAEGFKSVTVALNTEKDFGIDEDNLDAELCRMGQILCEYGEIFGELRAQLARDETIESRWRDAQDLEERKRPAPKGKKSPTEAKIKALVNGHEHVRAAEDKVNHTKRNLYKAENFYRSLHRKCDCLQALTYKHNREIKATGF